MSGLVVIQFDSRDDAEEIRALADKLRLKHNLVRFAPNDVHIDVDQRALIKHHIEVYGSAFGRIKPDGTLETIPPQNMMVWTKDGRMK